MKTNIIQIIGKKWTTIEFKISVRGLILKGENVY